jgi:hypothetical protein
MENLNMYVGKVIDSVVLGSDDALHFVFSNGSKMRLLDNGQNCCESRYMTTDDDLAFYSGSVLMSIEVRDAPDMDDGCEVHEVQFLEVMTNRGCFTMTTHNEHNGYYGGFHICIEAE